ncbi:MAG: hypothetical protein HFE63_06555 [Clostridiales bacterium]|nr:hypothetical protein [Clostridiales bacterium]
MANWWHSLTDLQHIFACIGIPATLILIVQTVLLLFGIGDGDNDTDIEIDDGDIGDNPDSSGDDGLALFSVRGIVAMFCIAGWAGIVFIDIGLGQVESILLAAVCGFAALFGMAYLMKAVLKLQSNGNIQIGSAVGKTGQVYIPIPPKGTGRGKINIIVQDRFIEVEAITDSEDTLKTGEAVRVVSTDDMGLVMVERVVK